MPWHQPSRIGARSAIANHPWRIETNGINKVADEERTGRISDLFWIWFAANIGILGVVYGAIILSFGLNFIQCILVIILGTASFFLVGAFSIAGRNGGAPMMTLSRKVFGIYGNILPNAISWISLVGWETISVITGTLALTALFSTYWHLNFTTASLLGIVTMLSAILAAGLLGHATLAIIQKWASYIFGALTILVIVLIIPKTHWHLLFGHPAGSWIRSFFPALTIIIAGTGLSWANAAGDYSRYLPKKVPTGAIVWSTALGGGLPLGVLMFVGILLATQVPTLASAANPIQAIGNVLPGWAAIPYLITAAGGLVVEGNLGLYSSGLNLLNMFVPLERYKTVVIDALIMTVGTIYVVLIAQNFFGPLEAFLTLLGIGLASWAGVFLAEQLFRSRGSSDYPSEMIYPARAANPIRYSALIGWAVGAVVGLLFTTSPFFTGPLAKGIFTGSSLELLIAFFLAGVIFLVLDKRPEVTREQAPQQ